MIVGGLRRMLARAAVEALEPDLVILDEFQRFRDLLDLKTGGEAAELAHEFFNQSDARVLLLSATPYKPFTYAEEAEDGAGHYADFLRTLEFLADADEPVESLQADLAAMRQAALAGEPTAPKSEIGCRPSCVGGSLAPSGRPATRARRLVDSETSPFRVQSDDFAGFVALRRVANEVKAPLSVEYWKSAPYFLNFLSGYRVGERVRASMKEAELRARLVPLFHGAQRIDKANVERFQPLEWGNARMRALYGATLKQGWWRLLWMPPSLPYHLTRRPVCVSRYDRDYQAAHFLQLGGRSLSYRFAAELRGPATDLHGSGARIEHARGPRGSGEAPRLPDGRWAAGRHVDALAVLAGPDACRAHRPTGRRPRPRGVAERGASAGVGVRPRRTSGRPERQHQFHSERSLALVCAGAGRAGQRPGRRASPRAADQSCRRAAGSFP